MDCMTSELAQLVGQIIADGEINSIRYLGILWF